METIRRVTVPADQRPWLRIGAAAALVIAAGYVAIFPLYAHVGAPPHDGSAWFAYLAGKTGIWWTILGVSVLTDLLFLPLTLALWMALGEISRNMMKMACALIALFVSLDLAITWPHYASILTLFERYSTTSDPARRAAYVAAAEYACAILSSPLEVVYAIVILSSGILLVALVMWRGSFRRVTAWLGLATGCLGLLSLTGSGLAIIGNAVFATVWLLFVAVGLRRLAVSR